jgi:hypothetical protein
MSNGLQKFILTIFILILAGTAPVFSQSNNPLAPKKEVIPFYIGPVVGYNRVLHSAELQTFESAVPCPVFENGSANGYFFGISFEYLLGGAKNSTQSIIARLLYNSMPASFEVVGDEYPSVLTDNEGNQTEVMSSTNHINEVTYDMISFDVQYKFNFVETFGVIVGPTFDFALTKDQEQLFQLVTPENARFEQKPDSEFEYSDDGRTLIAASGDIPNSSAFRAGIKFGVQYEIILNSGMYIVPNFNYNYGITNLSADDDWRVSALQFGVDIRFPSTSIF